jgi:hypothetical protein
MPYPMKTDDKTTQSLFDLVNSILKNKDRPEIELDWFPPRYGKIPADVKCAAVKEDSLLIGSKEENARYQNCLAFLCNEDSLKHVAYSELDKELWHFYCEIYCDSAKFKNDSEIKSVVNALLKRLNKPLIDYEVLIPLEKQLQLNGNTFDLAGVRFMQMSEVDIVNWGIDKNISVFHTKFYDAIIGKSVALLYEQCHGSDKAVENARKKLNAALNMLRVALLLDHDPRIVSWRIHDEEMLFCADEQYAVRQKGSSSPAQFGFHRGFRCVQFTIDSAYSNQIAESKRVIDSLFIPSNLQSGLYKRLRRALEWIGSSVTRERLDDKIVDICTALETLLSTQQDSRKGEAITLRMMLLYSWFKKPFFSPVKVLELYIKRSDIVHGSKRDTCLDYDYRMGQWIAIDVFNHVLVYVQANNITQHGDFFKHVESDLALIDKSVDFWKSYPDYYRDIVNAASEMLRNRFLRGTP